MTLRQYCNHLGWDGAELARQAGINPHTAGKALRGEEITARVARKIATALSTAMKETVNVGDIQGLNVQ